jgi:hypothetical protein
MNEAMATGQMPNISDTRLNPGGSRLEVYE